MHCHRDLNITRTDIPVKLFDDRLVVESSGNLPGLVRPDKFATLISHATQGLPVI